MGNKCQACECITQDKQTEFDDYAQEPKTKTNTTHKIELVPQKSLYHKKFHGSVDTTTSTNKLGMLSQSSSLASGIGT